MSHINDAENFILLKKDDVVATNITICSAEHEERTNDMHPDPSLPRICPNVTPKNNTADSTKTASATIATTTTIKEKESVSQVASLYTVALVEENGKNSTTNKNDNDSDSISTNSSTMNSTMNSSSITSSEKKFAAAKFKSDGTKACGGMRYKRNGIPKVVYCEEHDEQISVLTDYEVFLTTASVVLADLLLANTNQNTATTTKSNSIHHDSWFGATTQTPRTIQSSAPNANKSSKPGADRWARAGVQTFATPIALLSAPVEYTWLLSPLP
jgi:hypothetical protein